MEDLRTISKQEGRKRAKTHGGQVYPRRIDFITIEIMLLARFEFPTVNFAESLPISLMRVDGGWFRLEVLTYERTLLHN